MPLRKGKTRKIVGANISELVASGYSYKQAIAIALKQAGLSKYNKNKKKKLKKDKHGKRRHNSSPTR